MTAVGTGDPGGLRPPRDADLAFNEPAISRRATLRTAAADHEATRRGLCPSASSAVAISRQERPARRSSTMRATAFCSASIGPVSG
jgi:hypothetical protein